MKKLILLFVLATTLIGCTADEPTTVNDKLNPPTWIQGTWKRDNNGQGLRFKTDDIVEMLGGYETYSYKDMIEDENNEEIFFVEEEITADHYYVDIASNTGYDKYFEFEKISSVRIFYNGHYWDKL